MTPHRKSLRCASTLATLLLLVGCSFEVEQGADTPVANAPADATVAPEPIPPRTPPATPSPTPSAPPPAPSPAPGTEVRTTMAEAVAALPVAEETNTGYDRDLFGSWIDADGNGCTTRQEVLLVENRAEGAAVTSRCDLLDAVWFSYYDQTSTQDASQFDVDHLVPLAESFGSGARSWPAARKVAYANDLGDRRSLIAVSASSNRTKSDADPDSWLPGFQRCVYVNSWVAVKTRWGLRVDPAELAVLESYARRCGERRLTVRIAEVGPVGVTDARESILARYPAAVASSPSPQPLVEEGPGGGADPRFGTCGEAVDAGFGPYQRGRDPEYGWYTDGDSDGSVCE